jgi:hypothetical protein
VYLNNLRVKHVFSDFYPSSVTKPKNFSSLKYLSSEYEIFTTASAVPVVKLTTPDIESFVAPVPLL